MDGRDSAIELVGNIASGTQGSGGGIFSNGGQVTIFSTTLMGNEAERAGGAIEISGSNTITRLRITDSTIATNSALGTANAPGNGGGVHLSGMVTTVLVNSTVSGNLAARDGGGLWSQLTGAARLIMTNNTFTKNTARHSGGGVWTDAAGPEMSRAAVMYNTIIAQNIAGNAAPDLRTFGTLFAFNSLIGNGAYSGLTPDADGDANGNLIGSDVSNINAKLGALSDNGGSTETHLLLAGSPAIDRGNKFRANSLDGSPLTTDQRGLGFKRIRNGIVDIGAIES